MANETPVDKPLAGALKAAHEMNSAMVRAFYVNPQKAAEIIARESGLAELVEAVFSAAPDNYLPEGPDGIRLIMVGEKSWQRIVAAARRVREG